jgi:alpha-tubulin suppressor-like RCC1 family protein
MGWSADGQLGQGFEDKDIPSKLTFNNQIKKLSSSTDFTLALSQNGKLWTWGNSEYGQGIQGKIIDRVKYTQKTREDIIELIINKFYRF